MAKSVDLDQTVKNGKHVDPDQAAENDKKCTP